MLFLSIRIIVSRKKKYFLLLSFAGAIYEELVGFAKQLSGEDINKPKRPPLVRQESICVSPRKGVQSKFGESVVNGATDGSNREVKRDPQTGKGISGIIFINSVVPNSFVCMYFSVLMHVLRDKFGCNV